MNFIKKWGPVFLSFLIGTFVGYFLGYLKPLILWIFSVLMSISFSKIAGGHLSFLEALSFIAQIITAFSLVIALQTLKYQRRHDWKTFILGQVTFFRKEVLSVESVLSNEFFKKSKGKEYQFSKVDGSLMKAFTREEAERTSLPAMKLQEIDLRDTENFFKGSDDDPRGKVIDLLNVMEDFASQVIYTNTAEDHGLKPVQPPFVFIVESNMNFLFRLREANAAPYKSTEELFMRWKDKFDRGR